MGRISPLYHSDSRSVSYRSHPLRLRNPPRRTNRQVRVSGSEGRDVFRPVVAFDRPDHPLNHNPGGGRVSPGGPIEPDRHDASILRKCLSFRRLPAGPAPRYSVAGSAQSDPAPTRRWPGTAQSHRDGAENWLTRNRPADFPIASTCLGRKSMNVDDGCSRHNPPAAASPTRRRRQHLQQTAISPLLAHPLHFLESEMIARKCPVRKTCRIAKSLGSPRGRDPR
jgi:hypothetical protein